MKVGVKEFKERISEITERGEPVVVTNHGREIANYFPRKPKNPQKIKEAADAIRQWQEEMKAKGVDLEAVLAERGLDPWGDLLSDNTGH